MSACARNLSLSLIALLCLAVALPACSSSSKDDPEESAGGDAGSTEPAADAGMADASTLDGGELTTDAGESEPEDAGEAPAYTGCDLMEFAPEGLTGQGAESALLNLEAPSLGYFKEATWFTGGDDESGTWMIDAVRLSTSGDPIPFPVGTWKLEGANLGNRNDCTVCLDLGRGNMDVGGADDNFYPEDVELVVEAADLRAGGALKVKISGRFRKDGDPKGESWCVNGLTIDALLAQFCGSASDCPPELPVCAYPETGSYPVCQAPGAD